MNDGPRTPMLDSDRMGAVTSLIVSILLVTGLAACAASPAPAPGRVQLLTPGLPPGVHPNLRAGHDQLLLEAQEGPAVISPSLAPGHYTWHAAPIQVAGLTFDPVSSTQNFTIRSGKVLTLNIRYQLQSLAQGAAWREVAASISPEVTQGYAYLSCADSHFCMLTAALGEQGIDQWIWNGEAWSGPTSTGLGTTSIISLSCPSPDFCTMGTGSYQQPAPAFVDVWKGKDWVRESPVASRNVLFYVASCASTVSCLAIAAVSTSNTQPFQVQEDFASSWNGSRWIPTGTPFAPHPSGILMEPGQLTCPYDGTLVDCLLVSEPNDPSVSPKLLAGNLSTWNGHTWHPILQIADAQSIGCHTPNYCLAVAEAIAPISAAGATTYQGTASAWTGYPSGGLHVQGQPQCPLTGTCFAAVQPNPAPPSLNLWAWNKHHWSGTAVAGSMGGDPLLSCAADGFCLAVTDSGTYALG